MDGATEGSVPLGHDGSDLQDDGVGLQDGLDAGDEVPWHGDPGEDGGDEFGGDSADRMSDDDQDHPLGRSKELFIRWAQLSAFCPVMENGGGGEHRPWMFDSETTDIYRRFVGLHYAIIPYLTEEGARAFAAGLSLMTFFDAIEYQYLLGPDILIAPMLEEGTSRSVTFPNGAN